MWIKTENGEPVMPEAMEVSGNHVILRRDFRLIEATEDFPAHYEYDEWQMTADQYEVYKYYEDRIHEQSDALIELAEIISEVM